MCSFERVTQSTSLLSFPTLNRPCSIQRTTDFAVVVHRTAVQRALSHYIAGMEYDNFKASIRDEPYHEVCLDVWRTMWAYGKREGGE